MCGAKRRTYVSIQLTTTRPLTMLHRLNPSTFDPQSVPFVSAVVAADPIRNKICQHASAHRGFWTLERRGGGAYEGDGERDPVRKDTEQDTRRAEQEPEKQVY